MAVGNLFGDDSDSSDESVGAAPPPPSQDADGGPSPAAPPSAGRDAGADDAPADGAAAPSPAANKNSALFGDEDSSSDDGDAEFKGDDVKGTSGGGDAATARAAEERREADAAKTMSQRHGWDSDGDDDKPKPDGPDEADEKPAYVPPRKMDLLDLDPEKGRETTYHITKLPNLVGINYHPYDRRTHDPEAEEDHYRGYVHNMIRWRIKEDEDGEYVRDENGDPVRESNTRLVKWSDGSYTLHVGREVLEVDDLDGAAPAGGADGGFAGPKGYLYVSQKARVTPPTERELRGPPTPGGGGGEDADADGGPAPEPRPAGTVLECLGPVSSRFAPRPSSLTCDAHRNLTLAVRQRNVKRARIAEFVTEHDPEAEKRARIKGTDDLAKSRSRKGRGGGGGKKRMSKSYMEDDSEDGEYETVNVKKIKKKAFLADDDEDLDYGESSDEEDEWEEEKKRRPGRASGRKREEESESEDGEVVFGESDDEDAPTKKAKSTKKSAAVFGDDDDDD